jgi:pyruvate dehydrogenase E1 component alpha subunit
VAVAVGGDGSTSKGDFHEALNVVGAWRLPAVFVINNNQWAISVRRRDQTAAQTLAQKALAAGLPGEQVDGCDVIAVRAAVEAALARARAGGGGTLIECETYRLSDHTTADDASRYRDDAEVTAAWAREPVRRLRDHLAAAHGWTRAEEEDLRAAAEARVAAATEAWLATPPLPPAEMFAHLHAAPTADTRRDLADLEGRADA